MFESEKTDIPIDKNLGDALEDAKAIRDKQLKGLDKTDEDIVDIEMELVKNEEEEDDKLEEVRKKLDETEYRPENTL